MDQTVECRFVLAVTTESESKEAAAEFAQVVRQMSPKAFICVVVAGRFGKEGAAFVKKSGANMILLEEELTATSKLEFAAVQIIKSSYLPIKVADLIAGTVINFDIYHLMPQRKKFLKFVFDGDTLDEVKVAKLKKVSEFFISRDDADKFNKYVADHPDNSAAGLTRRCRANFLNLFASFANLAFNLTDQSEHASFKTGQEMLQQCNALGNGLMQSLAEVASPFDVVTTSGLGEFGAVDRSPAISAYAGLFSLLMSFNNNEDIMLAAMLKNIGLLMSPASIIKKIREDRINELTNEELLAYKRFPNQTLSILLDRKLSLKESVRKMILNTHEQPDGKGFPEGKMKDNLGEDAQLIRFCEVFDRKTITKMGKARITKNEAIKQIIEEDMGKFQLYTSDFIKHIEKDLLSK